MIDKAYLLRKLKILGIDKGDVLFIHSAFSAVGKVDGGASAFLDALQEAVGSEGTILFPTFTSLYRPFSRQTSASETGFLSELFRQRAGAVRSLHPTHSVAAIGRQADELTGEEWVTNTTCGEGSVYKRLACSEAKIMMLGVDLNRCTLLHVCEDDANLGYIVPELFIAPPVDRPDITRVKRFPPGHRAFIHLMEAMRDQSWFVQGFIGDARALIFPAKEMYAYCMNALLKDPYLFLCDNESCNYCVRVRNQAGGKTVAIDKTSICTDPVCEVCAL